MYNLILILRADKQDPADLVEIRSLIGKRTNDIRVHIVDSYLQDWAIAKAVANDPTMTVSALPISTFRPPRGSVFQGHEFPKSAQYERLTRCGIRVPDWQVIEPATQLDPNEWGPYVVVKPDLGRKGAEIKIKRTGRVRHKPAGGDILAQRFIYTGPWANYFRVVTLFGRPLLGWYCEIDHNYRALASRYDFKREGGITIVSNKPNSIYRLAFDEEVLGFAEAAHAAFPGQPLLAHDIVRDNDTRKLYMLECNPRGDAWLFSSYAGTEIQFANNIDFRRQFGGMARVADILIEETRRRAR